MRKNRLADEQIDGGRGGWSQAPIHTDAAYPGGVQAVPSGQADATVLQESPAFPRYQL